MLDFSLGSREVNANHGTRFARFLLNYLIRTDVTRPPLCSVHIGRQGEHAQGQGPSD
jgi:hypothetical protein